MVQVSFQNYFIDLLRLILLPSTTSPALKNLDSRTEVLFRETELLTLIQCFPSVVISVCNVRVWMDDPSVHLLQLNTRLSSYMHTAHCQSVSVWGRMKGEQTRLCRVMSRWMLGGLNLLPVFRLLEKQMFITSQGECTLVCKNVKLHSAIRFHDA